MTGGKRRGDARHGADRRIVGYAARYAARYAEAFARLKPEWVEAYSLLRDEVPVRRLPCRWSEAATN